MQQQTLMVSISGIRGVYGASLTPEVVVKYVKAFAALLQKYKQPGQSNLIVLGRDSRVSGPLVVPLVCDTIQCMGYLVLYLISSSTSRVLMCLIVA